MNYAVKPAVKPTLLERLSQFLTHAPEDRAQLLEVLHAAHERRLMDDDALTMIEGVLQTSELAARDIMVPRAEMDVIDINDTPEKFLPFVLHTAHSRFPVINGKRDDVLGILLAKDLLRLYADANSHEGTSDFNIRQMLRPVVFIPEAKRLNVLLREFRAKRNHIAMVVDEYGGIAGLVTIEDVLEQIVGDIDDEFDFDEAEDNIMQGERGHWRVKALTELADFNDHFKLALPTEDADTIGGYVIAKFGRVPKRGEVLSLPALVEDEAASLRIVVLRADSRQVHLLEVEPAIGATSPAGAVPPQPMV